MSYDPTSNPPHIIAQLIAGKNLWHYQSADLPAVVVGAGYFSNADEIGMHVNDAVLCTTLTAGEGSMQVLVVVRINADGSADCAYGEGDASLRADLASTASGKGADLVGLTQGGTVQDAIGYVTPEMFGAVGDGVADDSAAIQAAVNAVLGSGGGTLQFMAAKYLFTGITINWTNSPIRLVGQQVNGQAGFGTELIYVGAGNAITFNGNGASHNGYEVHRIKIRKSVAGNATAVKFDKCAHISVDRKSVV